jgi:RHS repeat-associated protein
MWDATTGGNQIQSVALEQSGGAPTNRIASVTSGGATVNYSYDAAGNVTNDGVHGYAYDAENRLVSVDGGGTGQYSYDYQNRRYKKVVGSAVTDYVWEGSRVLAEHNGSTGGVITDYVYRGGLMIAKVEGGVTSYFLRDRLSVRLVLDASGSIVGRQGHLPFGGDFAESGLQEKRHFTTYEREVEDGLDYAINRRYSVEMGLFMSSDPYRSTGTNPQSWNRYVYSRNDPVNLMDHLGLFAEVCPTCVSYEQGCAEFPELCYPHPRDPFEDGGDGGRAEPTLPCTFDVRLHGKQRSDVSSATTVSGADLGGRLGKYENPVPDGYWFYFYEVGVILPVGSTDLTDWIFHVSLVRTDTTTIVVDGVPMTLTQTTPAPDDTPSEQYTQLKSGIYYWIDTPGRRKVRTFNGQDYPIVEASVTFEFTFTATNNSNASLSCKGRLGLKFRIKDGKFKASSF